MSFILILIFLFLLWLAVSTARGAMKAMANILFFLLIAIALIWAAHYFGLLDQFLN